MSERLLEAFREEVESSTPLPDFELISAAGRNRRRRRHTVVAAVTACVLGVSGLVASTYGDRPGPQPARGPDSGSLITPFPGMDMTTLEEGVYALQPFGDPSMPELQFELPAGWNAWLGPNRYEGLDEAAPGDPRANGEALDSDPEWLLGMVVFEPQWFAQAGCTMVDLSGGDPRTIAQALVGSPRLEVVARPGPSDLSGHRGVHLRLRERAAGVDCEQDALMTTGTGVAQYLGRGTTYDARVIDIDGRPLVVWAAWTRDAPHDEVDDLLGIVDSVELVPPDPS